MKVSSIQCHCCGTMYGYMLRFDVRSAQVFRCVNCDRCIRQFLNAEAASVDDELFRIAKASQLIAICGHIRKVDDEEWNAEFQSEVLQAPFALKQHNYLASHTQQFKRNPAYDRAKRKEEKQAASNDAQKLLTENES